MTLVGDDERGMLSWQALAGYQAGVIMMQLSGKSPSHQ
jgi:hypothetical protein